ncbi:hypothetical protein QUF70_09360 [Desulfobacterales bacterium HSG17]|nr:hypothetical protein [Desulfobacterales bacterium HSG17]
MNLKLHIQPQTEKRLKKILIQTQDEEIFVQNIIEYQIKELQNGIMNLQLDMKEFEDKYKMTSKEFYQKFEKGFTGDNEDFILWSGIYEMFCENEHKLSELI